MRIGIRKSCWRGGGIPLVVDVLADDVDSTWRSREQLCGLAVPCLEVGGNGGVPLHRLRCPCIPTPPSQILAERIHSAVYGHVNMYVTDNALNTQPHGTFDSAGSMATWMTVARRRHSSVLGVAT